MSQVSTQQDYFSIVFIVLSTIPVFLMFRPFPFLTTVSTLPLPPYDESILPVLSRVTTLFSIVFSRHHSFAQYDSIPSFLFVGRYLLIPRISIKTTNDLSSVQDSGVEPRQLRDGTNWSRKSTLIITNRTDMEPRRLQTLV